MFGMTDKRFANQSVIKSVASSRSNKWSLSWDCFVIRFVILQFEGSSLEDEADLAEEGHELWLKASGRMRKLNLVLQTGPWCPDSGSTCDGSLLMSFWMRSEMSSDWTLTGTFLLTSHLLLPEWFKPRCDCRKQIWGQWSEVSGQRSTCCSGVGTVLGSVVGAGDSQYWQKRAALICSNIRTTVSV